MALNVTDNTPGYLTCVDLDLNIIDVMHTSAVRSSFVWACIANGILAVHTAILNSLVVLLYFKDKRLQTTANVLVLALALTDLFVAVVCQPVTIVNIALKLNGIYSCVFQFISSTLTEVGIGLSRCTVFFTITIERLLAVRWPLKHRVLVTKSRLKKTFLIETAIYVVVLPSALISAKTIFIALQSVGIIFGLLLVLAVYICIFVTVHKRSKTIARNFPVRECLEKEQGNSKQQKLPEENVSLDSKQADETNDCVSQHPKVQHKPANYHLKNSKTFHKNTTQNFTGVFSEVVSCDSKRTSTEIAPLNSNMEIATKTLNNKPVCPFKACVALQKAMSKLKKEKRTCKTMSMVAGALLLCFVPRAVIFQCAISGAISIQTFYGYLHPWLDVLAYANSSLNPYIYFFHNKDMTEAAKKILFRKSSAQLNGASLPLA